MSDEEFRKHFKKNYRLMTEDEREAMIQRLESQARSRYGKAVDIDATDASAGAVFGYAFNLSKCNGSRKCVQACCDENNQDRSTNIQYIRMKQMDNDESGLEHGTSEYDHATPPAGKYWLGTQCHQCDNPACVKACPVGATWKEPDGITVVDYDWCIGCRYCQAACPYFARRFNWQEPSIPAKDVNPKQHYLGNRVREKGVMEKCTFCVQRTRKGENPACVDACPTGARIFGNLMDPNSEIRYVLANKNVFRLKEELGTEPKFWYFRD
jgi:molybdopterin-containing oxidoreductase family iron-sulfur binding subunit